MNSRQDFSPIAVAKVATKPSGLIPADFLEPARVQPCYAGMDDTANYAESLVTKSGNRSKNNPMRVVWWGMHNRCNNTDADSYPRYGGRGIKVCARWSDFEAFAEDMGPRPSKQHQLDRIDNDGDYEPANCRWATPKTQSRNRSDNKFIEFNGERLIQKDWAARTGISDCTIGRRLAQGWSVEDALTVPPIKGYHTRIETAESYAQSYRPAKPADTDDVFSQDEDAEEAQDVRELLAASPTPTPNGKWVGIAMDACAQLIELQRLIGELDFFSAGDTGLGRLQQENERIDAILQRAGYRNGAAA